MRVFVDTNVLLDVLARRQPFYKASARIWSLAEAGEITAHISAISFNNIYYIVRKLKNKKTADDALRLLRDVFEPTAADGQTADSLAQFIVDVGRTKHRFSLGRPVDVTKTVLNSALAISQFPLSNLVHSKCPPLSSLLFLSTQL